MTLLRGRTVVLHRWRALMNGLTLLLILDHTARRHGWRRLPMRCNRRDASVEAQELDLVGQVANGLLEVANHSLRQVIVSDRLVDGQRGDKPPGP